MNAFDTNTPYHDSFDAYFGTMSNHSNFLPNLGSYETLKSKGIELISNDSLRLKLAGYYEQDIKYALAFEDINESVYPRTVEMYYEHFVDWKLTESAKPRNFTDLRSNERFRSYLFSTAGFRELEIANFIGL